MKPRLGFIGLGYMGAPMATNLASKGFPLVVYNRTQSKADELCKTVSVGRGSAPIVVSKPRNIVEQGCDIVCICLAKEAASKKVLFGKDGLYPALEAASLGRKPTVVIDHSTVSPKLTKECHKEAKRVGASFLDAPISGGPEGAKAGTLAIMVGGDSLTFEKAKPVLEAMGTSVARMGESGSGTAMKLVNQMLVGIHNTAAAEAFLFAKSLGLTDMKTMAALMQNSYGNSKMFQRMSEVWTEARENHDKSKIYHSQAPMRLVTKDLKIIGQWSKETGLNLPTTANTIELFSQMCKENPEGDITWPLIKLDKEEPPEAKRNAFD